jgi:hypothetical protein
LKEWLQRFSGKKRPIVNGMEFLETGGWLWDSAD